MAEENPFDERLESLVRRAVRRRLDAVLLFGEANIRAVTDVVCDNGCLVVSPHASPTFITDFRYVPMAHRMAPWLKTMQLKRGQSFADAAKAALPRGVRRLGYEGSVPACRYRSLLKSFRRAELVDVAEVGLVEFPQHRLGQLQLAEPPPRVRRRHVEPCLGRPQAGVHTIAHVPRHAVARVMVLHVAMERSEHGIPLPLGAHRTMSAGATRVAASCL